MTFIVVAVWFNEKTIKVQLSENLVLSHLISYTVQEALSGLSGLRFLF
jgi:hypothetical protein